MQLIKPNALKEGDTIGVFTPSVPAYKANEELFLNGIKNLEAMGFKVKFGSLTKKRASEGYRSGSGKARADEFMELINDPEVKCLISTIGGSNSNSMIPYLDFKKIRESKKVICGYSDVTSLHLAILHYSGLKTFYGPAVMTWFGEWPSGIKESTDSFLDAVTNTQITSKKITPFPEWSNHTRDWKNGDWKNKPRAWKKNSGWTLLNEGEAEGEIITANLNTFVLAAGTPYFPQLKNRILLLESMSAPFSREERSFMQLKLMGVFDQIKGLIIGKAEVPETEGAPFTHDELIIEIVGPQNYPIISNFDCSHTLPMHTIQLGSKIYLKATKSGVEINQLEALVE